MVIDGACTVIIEFRFKFSYNSARVEFAHLCTIFVSIIDDVAIQKFYCTPSNYNIKKQCKEPLLLTQV